MIFTHFVSLSTRSKYRLVIGLRPKSIYLVTGIGKKAQKIGTKCVQKCARSYLISKPIMPSIYTLQTAPRWRG